MMTHLTSLHTFASAPSWQPMVSVCMITYNHEQFIAQAIESVMMQQTAFAVELIIGEDCSTDNTRAIVEEYQERYPGKIRLITTLNNVGPNNNFIRTYEACCGEYVALLEGDDYWTDPNKLARQVEFLEAHSDFSFCFHNALVVYEDGSEKVSHLMTPNSKSEYSLDDITKGWTVATASVVFRRNLLPTLPDWACEGTASDLPVFAILANQGRVGFLPEVMSVYRINRGGVTRAGDSERHMLGIVRMHENVDYYLNRRYRYNMNNKLIEDYIILTNLMLASGEQIKARNYLLRALRLKLINGKLPSVANIKALVTSIFPKLAKQFGKASKNQIATT